ncbi:MAG: cyclic nucleotide-binding domain-containing protein [Magnetococcales bacterium]|nr:cyclic nucleotide-binding domain-containing protein [Magnetococcales bacterium]
MRDQVDLSLYPFSRPFGREEQAVLLADPENLRAVQPGEVLIREGEHDRDMWLLLAGRYMVIKQVQPHFPLGTLQAGSFCGEIAWFTGQARTASIIATEPGLALRLSFARRGELAETLLVKVYHNVLADVSKRKVYMNQILFRLAELERVHYGASPMSSPVGYIKGGSFFDGFTPEQERLLRTLPPGMDRLRPGDRVFSQGERGDAVFILLRGSVMVAMREAPDMPLIHLGPERVVGMDALFGHAHDNHCIATETCEGLRISLEALEALDAKCRVSFYGQVAISLINRLASLNLARIKLEHMEGKMWFGG